MTSSPKNSSAVALVSGASRGIGRACAEALHHSGFRVALHYRSDSHLAHKVSSTLDGSQTFCYDLTDPEAAQKMIHDVKEQMGEFPDVLINNAGITIDKLAMMTSDADFDQLITTNLGASFRLCRAMAKPMMRKKSGRIINITSIIGHTGQRGQSIYSATKAAITAFTQSLAGELGRFGVLCNCVAPGYIDTQMTEDFPEARKQHILTRIHLERSGSPKEVGDVVAFLASDKASYITGTTIHVNGGMAGF